MVGQKTQTLKDQDVRRTTFGHIETVKNKT